MTSTPVVVDTSALIAVLVNAPEKTWLLELTAGAELVSPASVHWEVGNAFSAMLKRKRTTAGQAMIALQAYETIPLRFIQVSLAEALELSDQLGIYAYDAYLLVASRRQNAALLTLDGGLAKAARKIGVRVMEEIS